MKNWLKRNDGGRGIEDPNILDNIQYNSMSGGQKNLNVGPALEYINVLTAAVAVPKGAQLFIYNTTASDIFITMGDDTVTLLGTPGDHSFPCAPGLTAYSAAEYSHVIGTASLHLYILRDETIVRNNP